MAMRSVKSDSLVGGGELGARLVGAGDAIVAQRHRDSSAFFLGFRLQLRIAHAEVVKEVWHRWHRCGGQAEALSAEALMCRLDVLSEDELI